MIAPKDVECHDNCGHIIKKGEKCFKIGNDYLCVNCDYDRKKEQEREDAMARLD